MLKCDTCGEPKVYPNPYGISTCSTCQHIAGLESENEAMRECLKEVKKSVDRVWENYKICIVIEGLNYWTAKAEESE